MGDLVKLPSRIKLEEEFRKNAAKQKGQLRAEDRLRLLLKREIAKAIGADVPPTIVEAILADAIVDCVCKYARDYPAALRITQVITARLIADVADSFDLNQGA